jgi:hypothetical protein
VSIKPVATHVSQFALSLGRKRFAPSAAYIIVAYNCINQFRLNLSEGDMLERSSSGQSGDLGPWTFLSCYAVCSSLW